MGGECGLLFPSLSLSFHPFDLSPLPSSSPSPENIEKKRLTQIGISRLREYESPLRLDHLVKRSVVDLSVHREKEGEEGCWRSGRREAKRERARVPCGRGKVCFRECREGIMRTEERRRECRGEGEGEEERRAGRKPFEGEVERK